jgi:peptidoglycan/LPS O-acetylase OafA/YrhL
MENGKNRLLFFDILRILSVALIVLGHIIVSCGFFGFLIQRKLILGFFSPGAIGVYVLIFISGAVLEYSHPRLSTVNEVLRFYVKRLFRIYPAFWMSMIISLVCTPAFLLLSPGILLTEFSGFNTWTGAWGGVINPVGWFIGVIITLYFAYPFLSAAIRKHPYITLFIITLVEIVARSFLNFYPVPMLGQSPDRWLPFCNFLEFGLGIWIVQQNFYPKWTHNNAIICFLAEISFYIFLIHYIKNLMFVIAPKNLPFYLLAVGLLGWLMMLGDQKIQSYLKKFLK